MIDFLPFPTKPTNDMAHAGATALRAYFPNLTHARAGKIALELWQDMASARPKAGSNRIGEGRYADLTPRQLFYFHLFHDLAEELGRLPVATEAARAIGGKRTNKYTVEALKRLDARGYLRYERRGNQLALTWLRPRGKP